MPRYYAYIEGQVRGPFVLSELCSLHETNGEFLVCEEGRTEWISVDSFGDFQKYIQLSRITPTSKGKQQARQRRIASYLILAAIVSSIAWYAGYHRVDLRPSTSDIPTESGRLNTHIAMHVDAPLVDTQILQTSIPPKWVSPKGVSRGSVKIIGRRIYVSGDTFTIRGVGYSPVPIGKHISSAKLFVPEHWNRDLPLLREMGCNVIRTWMMVDTVSFLDACWNNGRNPIYVIMGFPISNDSNYADSAQYNAMRSLFRTYVDQYRSHPAILMWALGNENNYFYTKSPINDFYRLCDTLAYDAFVLEKNRYHPVAIVNGRLFEPTGRIGDKYLETDDQSLAYVDVWGSNLYWGRSFGDLFQRYAWASEKPLWLSEYGIDAFNELRAIEYEDTHAAWIIDMWREINGTSDICIGGTLMEYCDEWWKASNGTADTQDTFGYPAYATQPDEFANEEWWGIMRVFSDPSDGVNAVKPRRLYFMLKKEWTRGMY